MNPAALSTMPGSTAAIGMIAELLEQRTGQQIASTRAWRLDTALQPVLRDLGMASLDELVSRLVTARDPTLSDRVVDALLNQETSFFRDVAVLDLVGDAAVALHRAADGRRLRIWSSGCSTGQEPLSLAMLLHERGLDGEVVEIVATDVSFGAIARAKSGKYSQFEVQRGLSIRRMIEWFDGDGPEWTVKRELLRRIQFRQHNLITDASPAGQFDIILCRNVLLYFSPELRRGVFDTLARASRPGAVLVLGASETVIGQTDRFLPAEHWRGLYAPKMVRV